MPKVRLMKNEEFKLNDSEKLVGYYRQFPSLAAKDLLGIDLIWYQRIALRSVFNKRYTMFLMGRGCGKTWLVAVAAVLHALLFPKSRIGVIAPSFKQAEFFFDKIGELYDNSPYVRAAAKGKPLRATYKARIMFRNGSFIEGLPLGTGQKVRGQRYNFLIIDEYAQVDEEIIKTVVLPMMTVKYKGITNKTVIASSAYYTWNHLYSQYIRYSLMMKEKPDEYALHEHNYLDVKMVPEEERPFDMDEEIIEMIRLESTEEQFEMEVMGKFPTESTGFINQQLIDKCTPRNTITSSESPIEAMGELTHEYSMGIDAARVQGGDNFSISIMKIDKFSNNIKRYVYCKAWNGITYQQMIYEIRKALKEFPVSRIYMDAGGGGLTLKDLLAEPYDNKQGVSGPPILDMNDKATEGLFGARILSVVNFTRPFVNDLYMRSKADMQHGTIAFPLNVVHHGDKNLNMIAENIIETKKELLMLQAEPMDNYYKFSVPPQFKKDRATSFALANWAANEVLENPILIQKQEPAVGFWV